MSKVESINRQYITQRVRDIARRACAKTQGMKKKVAAKLPTSIPALQKAIASGDVRLTKTAKFTTPLGNAFDVVEKVHYDNDGANRIRSQVSKEADVIRDLLAVNDPKNLDKIAKLFNAFVTKWEQ